MKPLSSIRYWRHPGYLLAVGFGSGALPRAPGTFGTFAAIPFYMALDTLPQVYFWLAIVVLFAVGIWLCDITAKALQVHDHPGIVWDEFVGYFLAMALAPPGWGWALLGAVLFRVFDIWKPWPISWCDKRVKGGLGIMIDDIVAALYVLPMLYFLGRFWG